jgi:hypothetical protein
VAAKIGIGEELRVKAWPLPSRFYDHDKQHPAFIPPTQAGDVFAGVLLRRIRRARVLF